MLKPNKAHHKDIILTVVTIVAFLFLAALAATGLDFSVENFKKAGFYVATGINFAAMLVTWNMTRETTIRTEKNKSGTPYGQNKERESRIVKEIRDGKFEDVILEAVEEENTKRYAEAVQTELDKISVNFDISKIEDTVYIEQFKRRKRLTAKDSRRLDKVLYNVLQGKVEYKKLTYREVMLTSGYNKDSEKEFSVDERRAFAADNFKKAGIFLVSTLVINAISFRGVNQAFLIYLLTQTVLFLTSIWTGYSSGHKLIERIIIACENKCDFLKTALDKSASYIETLAEKDKALREAILEEQNEKMTPPPRREEEVAAPILQEPAPPAELPTTLPEATLSEHDQQP